MIDLLVCPSPYDKLQPVFSILVDVVGLLKIIVPIALILFGMIDFGKAVISKNDDEVKKAQGMFIKRAIMAVAVFFVITLVTMITEIVAKYVDDNTDINAESWIDCFNLRSSGGSTGGGNYGGGGSTGGAGGSSSGTNSTNKSYYSVFFKSDEHGGLTGVTLFYVNKGASFKQNVKVPTPIVIPNDGYTFEKWSPSISTNDNFTVTKDLTYTAIYAKDENNNEIPDSNDTYYDIKFSAGTNGSLNGDKSFRVLTGLKFYDKVNVPTVTPNEGYEFVGFDVTLPDLEYKVDKDQTYTAIYKKIG